MNKWTDPVQMRKRLIRKVILGLMLGVVLGLFGAHNAGYGVLISDSGPVEPPVNGVVMLKCTYFTGTEKVINHVMRRTSDPADKAITNKAAGDKAAADKQAGDKAASMPPTPAPTHCPFYTRVMMPELTNTLQLNPPPRDDLPGLGPNIHIEQAPPETSAAPTGPAAPNAGAPAPAAPAP